MSEASLIDWTLAERTARALAGNGSGKRSVRQSDLERASRGCVKLVRDYTGLDPGRGLPRPELIDRREWITVNVSSLRLMSGPMEARAARALELPGRLGVPLRQAAGAAAGVELGLASAFLAQRVLGQYDVALIGPERPPRLLFVAPNLAEAQRRIGAERGPFLRWVALHETTHVVQFGAVPWLRGHIGRMAEELLDGAFGQINAGAVLAAARRLLRRSPRELGGALRDGGWASPLLGTGRVRLLRRLQATMALVEGYCEHVMDAVAAKLDPAYPPLREKLESRREQRGLLEALLARLLGLDLKMRQYRVGKAFCDEVAARRGIAALNLAWSEPAALPRHSELEQPGRWLSRVA